MKAMKKFQSWLIYIAAIGLGFFAFVITAGVLQKIFSPRFVGLPAILLITIISLAAAYFTSKYSRRFMSRHIFKTNRQAPDTEGLVDAGAARNKRIAMALFFSGTVLFPVFIFVFLSSIINLYV